MKFIKQRIKSFSYAIKGALLLLKEEPNVRIHISAGLLAILAGFLFQISLVEWLIVIICIGGVLALEAINSAIECLADYVSPEKQELIKKTKDLAAAGVLIISIASLIIGLLVFIPKLMLLLDAV